MEKETCSSCKVRITNLTGSVRFKCPNCGKQEIIRCKNCKQLGAVYTCAQCGFEGPN